MKREDFLKIAQDYGCPIYVYDAEQIVKKYNELCDAFSTINSLQINYAVKALSNISILKLLRNEGSGLDTVSIQEVMLGLEAGFDAKKIIYTPNGVSMSEIEEVIKTNVQINIDNLSILEQFGNKYPEVPVSIRLNPHILAGGSEKISVGHIDSKFGISIHQVPHIKRIIENTGMKINGLHMHTGSDILDIEVFLYASEILFDIAKSFKNLNFIDFGSGFKISYHSQDVKTNIKELGKKFSKKFLRFEKDYGKSIKLIFEPGKYLVSEAGYFLTKVNVVKQTTSSVFAGIDSGFNHFIRPMFYSANHQIKNISNSMGKERYYSVVGYICEMDTFSNNAKIAEISEGDILCFYNAGAYCYSMVSNYNSRYRPCEVLFYKGKSHLIRKRDTFEDLIRNQVIMDI